MGGRSHQSRVQALLAAVGATTAAALLTACGGDAAVDRSRAAADGEQDILDRGVAEGDILAVPLTSPQAVLNVAQQLNAVVVSMEDLARFRTPFPWIAEQGRCVKVAKVERDWVFV